MKSKLKYQGGLTKLLCRSRAALNKKRFRQQFSEASLIPQVSRQSDFEVMSLSGADAFEEQVLSIYSFLYYGGMPTRWTLYSDKTYTDEQKDFFTNEFKFLRVLDWDVYEFHKTDKYVGAYLDVCPMAKKLNILLGHSYTGPTLYLDSDIMIYKNIAYYFNSPLLKSGLWYAADTIGDINLYFRQDRESLYALNAGFLLFNKEFDRTNVFKYMEGLQGKYDWFSEQSSIEYAFRMQGAQMLDPRQFIIDSDDQFDFGIKFRPDEIAMRHYTSPVRHKMFQHNWKWHFNGL